jgi:putative transposase
MPVKSFDSSTISLCKNLFEWAKFRKNKSGIKMHTLLNNETGVPDFLAITEARGHDSKGLWKIPIEENTIYVLDRAYLCLKWLYSVVLNNSHFVMRLKTNTKYKVLKRFKVNKTNKNRGVILDHEIKFTGTKKDEYPQSLRKIKFKHFESGQIFEFITDNFELSPFTISEIYKDRWQIELFFKKIKQNLKIKKFIGFSENAVQIQIWTALIVLLLFEYAKFLSKASLGLKEFLSIVQPNLFSKKQLESLLHFTEWRDKKLNHNSTIHQFMLF